MIKVIGNMMIDTGSPFAVVCPLSVIEDKGVFNKQEVIKSRGTFLKWPFTTADYNYVSKAKTLRFGDLTVDNILVYFAELPAMFTSPLLGKEFLEHYITTIDFAENKVFLEQIDDEFKDNLYSVGLAVKKLENKTIVRGIWQNSPADQCGIQINDEIISINDQETQKLTLHQIDSLLEDPAVPEISLLLENEGGVRSVTLEKKYLIRRQNK